MCMTDGEGVSSVMGKKKSAAATIAYLALCDDDGGQAGV